MIILERENKLQVESIKLILQTKLRTKYYLKWKNLLHKILIERMVKTEALIKLFKIHQNKYSLLAKLYLN